MNVSTSSFTEPNNNSEKDLNRNEEHYQSNTSSVIENIDIFEATSTVKSCDANKIKESVRTHSSILTPKMARLVRSDRKIRVKYNHDKIVYVCFFCECTSSKTINGWLQHITDHTDENYDKCKVKENGQPVFGYICKECNYVQLEKSRVIHHLREKHRTPNNNYKKIVLLPRKPKLPKPTVHVQVHVHHHHHPHKVVLSNAGVLV